MRNQCFLLLILVCSFVLTGGFLGFALSSEEPAASGEPVIKEIKSDDEGDKWVKLKIFWEKIQEKGKKINKKIFEFWQKIHQKIYQTWKEEKYFEAKKWLKEKWIFLKEEFKKELEEMKLDIKNFFSF